MNAIDSLMVVMTTPVAKRNGITISAEDCKVWAEEIDKQMNYMRSELKKYYELKAKVIRI
jgi:hypothetical protein